MRKCEFDVCCVTHCVLPVTVVRHARTSAVYTAHSLLRTCADVATYVTVYVHQVNSEQLTTRSPEKGVQAAAGTVAGCVFLICHVAASHAMHMPSTAVVQMHVTAASVRIVSVVT